ncbi:hypothetical protein ACEN2J_11910 [Pseudorhodobacter sp. W20_MBD10_FR17]|uniref:hypothetical protein n=1 Tax=Pseudorhodobacter sp. W20_MBD10_FR17 TaxID=3240266 RepID=UPI003F9649EB
MNTLYMGAMGDLMPMRDVAMPQAKNLNNHLCISFAQKDIVSLGRTQAADTLHWARDPAQSALPSPQKTRSRGCRRALKQFWRFAQLLSSQLAVAQKSLKLFTLNKQFPKSQYTLVNTSNIRGRAFGAFRAVPALFCSAPAMIGGAA